MEHEMIWEVPGVFVREGVVVALPLCFPGQTISPPAGETAIATLAFDANATTIYCGTKGTRAHVLTSMIYEDRGVVIDVGAVPDATSVDGLCVCENRIFIVASGKNGAALWSVAEFDFDHSYSLIQEWDLGREPYEKVCDLFSEHSVAQAIPVSDGCAMIGIVESSGEVFRVDLKSKQKDILGKVDKSGHFSRALVLDRSGRLWGSSGLAQLWVCDVSRGEVECTDMEAPAAAGRSPHTQVSAWALDPFTGILYGGTTPDGYLFKFDPESRELVPLGKPTIHGSISCMSVGNDGRLFGMSGAEDDIAHMFSYDPRSGALSDMGIPVSSLTVREYGYHFSCAATGPNGEIFFGQGERINHLWVYFPSVPRRVPVRE